MGRQHDCRAAQTRSGCGEDTRVTADNEHLQLDVGSAPARIRWRRIVRAFFVLVLGGLVVYAAMLTLIMWRGGTDEGTTADAVLVLGARAYSKGRPSPCLIARVRRGVELVQSGRGRVLVVSGGDDAGDGRNEADEMERMARELGYDGQVLKERHAKSTAENLSKSRSIIEGAGLRSTIVVTHRYHAWRTRLTAGHEGWTVRTVVASGGHCDGVLDRVPWREPLAFVANKALGNF